MYAYLRVQTDHWDRVSFPDGTQKLVDRGAGPHAAADWRREQAEVRSRNQTPVDHEAPDEAQRRYTERHSQWQRDLDHALDGGLSIGHVRSIRSEFTKTHPEPMLGDAWGQPSPPAEADALAIPIPDVSVERRWIARLAEFEPVFELVLGPDGPYPRAAVARTLSELETLGWSVRHVTEDRAIRHTDDGAQAHVVGAWVLLHSQI